MKKLFLLAAAIMAFASAGVAVVSCTNVDEINGFDNGIGNSKEPDFQMQLTMKLESFMDKAIVQRCAAVADFPVTADEPAMGVKRMYLDVSCVDEQLAKNVATVKTPREIMTLVNNGADLSIENDGTYGYVLDISEEKCKIALNDMLIFCKKIMRSRGVTEEDMELLLKDAETDEYSFIPVTLGMLEMEELQIGGEYNEDDEMIGFDLDWEKVQGCAIDALFGTIFDLVRQAGLKSWTKKALKQLLRTVASKFFGPVGATMFVLDFIGCYFLS